MVRKSSHAGCLDCAKAPSTGDCWCGVGPGRTLVSRPLQQRDALWAVQVLGGTIGRAWDRVCSLVWSPAFHEACEMFWKLHVLGQAPEGWGGFLLVAVVWVLFPPVVILSAVTHRAQTPQ